MKNPRLPKLARVALIAVPAFVLGFLTGGAAIGILAGRILAVFIAAAASAPIR